MLKLRDVVCGNYFNADDVRASYFIAELHVITFFWTKVRKRTVGLLQNLLQSMKSGVTCQIAYKLVEPFPSCTTQVHKNGRLTVTLITSNVTYQMSHLFVPFSFPNFIYLYVLPE